MSDDKAMTDAIARIADKVVECYDSEDTRILLRSRITVVLAAELRPLLAERECPKGYEDKWCFVHSKWLRVCGCAAQPVQQEREQLLRRELWLSHGHEGLYGDDGEMSQEER